MTNRQANTPQARPDPKRRIAIATSFADPDDIEAFRIAKAQGMTDKEAFRFGDNGIGKWGDPTTENRPMVALPPDDWTNYPGDPRGALVGIEYKGRVITAELRDTMPWRKNIKNGAGIDLNPAACKALGLRPPIRVTVVWWWQIDAERFPHEIKRPSPIEEFKTVISWIFDKFRWPKQGRGKVRK
jgi:hypothetical protein